MGIGGSNEEQNVPRQSNERRNVGRQQQQHQQRQVQRYNSIQSPSGDVAFISPGRSPVISMGMAEAQVENALSVNEELLRVKVIQFEQYSANIQSALKSGQKDVALRLMKKRKLLEFGMKGIQAQIDNLNLVTVKMQQVESAKVTKDALFAVAGAVRESMMETNPEDIDEAMKDLGECFDDANQMAKALSKDLYLDATSESRLFSDANLEAELEEEMNRMKAEEEEREEKDKKDAAAFQKAFPLSPVNASASTGRDPFLLPEADDDSNIDNYLKETMGALFS